MYRSLAGVYGDEGPDVAAHVKALSEALTVWDRNIAAAELGLRSRLKDADMRTALEVHVTATTALQELRARSGSARQ